MIDCYLTFDHSAIRGGYYAIPQSQTVRTAMRFVEHRPSYVSMKDNYAGRVPHNILTEEIYGD